MTRWDGMDRVRTGLTGLGAVFLFTLAASLLFGGEPSAESRQAAQEKAPGETLAQLGVAPGSEKDKKDKQVLPPEPAPATPLDAPLGAPLDAPLGPDGLPLAPGNGLQQESSDVAGIGNSDGREVPAGSVTGPVKDENGRRLLEINRSGDRRIEV